MTATAHAGASTAQARRAITPRRPALLGRPTRRQPAVKTALLHRRSGSTTSPHPASRRPLLLRRPEMLLLLVTVFLALQFLIPARKVFTGLGAAGRPSMAVAIGLGIIWVAAWLCVDGLHANRQPVRWLVAAFLLSTLLSFAVGHLRGLSPDEAASSDRRLLTIVALCTLALAVADGLRDRRMVDVVLQRLTHFAGAMAAVGAVQSLTPFDPIPYIQIPGLVNNKEALGISARGDTDFARVASTATHYIEFGVVLAMVTPIAVHYALHSVGRGQAVRRWALTALIAAGVPFAISRSGAVALVVAVAVLACAWTWRIRLKAAVAGLLGVLAFSAVQPGRLGTIRSLFQNTENDPSVQGRIEDYAAVQGFFVERPWFGRGLGTFLPDTYILLDNEYLYLAVTGGIIAVVGFLLVMLGGWALARSIRIRGADDSTRHLGQALAAGFAVALIASGTFDSLSFPTFSGLLFLLLGTAGALWRVDRDGGVRATWPAARGERVATPLVHRAARLPLGTGSRVVERGPR